MLDLDSQGCGRIRHNGVVQRTRLLELSVDLAVVISAVAVGSLAPVLRVLVVVEQEATVELALFEFHRVFGFGVDFVVSLT